MRKMLSPQGFLDSRFTYQTQPKPRMEYCALGTLIILNRRYLIQQASRAFSMGDTLFTTTTELTLRILLGTPRTLSMKFVK